MCDQNQGYQPKPSFSGNPIGTPPKDPSGLAGERIANDFIQSIEVLDPAKDSVLLVRISDYDMDIFEPMMTAIKDRLKDILVVFNIGEISSLNEAEMNKAGWYKENPMKWIPEVKRIEDMSSKGYLRIMRDGDGDVIVAVHGMCDGIVQHCEAVEFCVGRGGNRSPNTVNALIRLAEAMEKDNSERPIKAG